jgi:hypothetical protein
MQLLVACTELYITPARAHLTFTHPTSRGASERNEWEGTIEQHALVHYFRRFLVIG